MIIATRMAMANTFEFPTFLGRGADDIGGVGAVRGGGASVVVLKSVSL